MFTKKLIPAHEPDGWDRWLERYVKRLETASFAGRTIAARRGMLARFFDYARDAKITSPEAAGTGLIRAYLLYRRETPNTLVRKDTPRTTNTHVMAMRSFLEFLAKEGIVSPRLVDAMEYVRTSHPLPKDIPTDAEVRRLLGGTDPSSSTGFRNRAVMEVLYSTGMRRQELSDLKVGDVDLERGYIRIELGKGGKGRVVPVGRVAAEWLKRYLLAVRPELLRGKMDEGWLFISKSGQQFDGNSIREAIAKARRMSGVEKNITPHALRRACATEMIRHKANPYFVKELLGHNDLRTMNVYVRLNIVDLKEAHRLYHPREQVKGEGGNEAQGPLGRDDHSQSAGGPLENGSQDGSKASG